ncbi:PepSY domain-containing protein [uncultured Martelella sp.]|uniref:PepSY domain-containing protein n=1 Tax=uncultured Martelella sp. TaxID=392331 RepID=UPI0029C94C5F|nr:PepSY domain-containing protein [uncultured Martelella sp.]
MKRIAILTTLVLVAPLSALAMTAVGDVVGTNPQDATAALEKAGCSVRDFEAEGGMIEAKCTDEANRLWEVYIDPASGAVKKISGKD